MAEATPLTVREALLLVLDQVDYKAGACGLTEMVGACLPAEVIDKARQALAADGVIVLGEPQPTPAHTCMNAGTSAGACKTHCGDKVRCWGNT